MHVSNERIQSYEKCHGAVFDELLQNMTIKILLRICCQKGGIMIAYLTAYSATPKKGGLDIILLQVFPGEGA